MCGRMIGARRDVWYNASMQKFDEYFALESEIYSYFNYSPNWTLLPLEDQRSLYWILKDDGVIYAKEPITATLIENDGEYYSAYPYMQMSSPQWVFRGKDFTLISMDTESDGNKVLGIFSNEREQQMTDEIAEMV